MSAAERAQLAAAKEQAARDLIRELASQPHPELVCAAGVPSREAAIELSLLLREQLWRRA
jgi:hypothetical protein